MSAIAEAPIDALSGDRLAKRNALVLAVGQALAGGNNTVIVATASILGSMLAPDKSLATLPISMMVVGIWAGTLPVGFLAKRYGRRTAYVSASVCGAIAGLIGYAAVIQGSFLLLLLGTFFGGLYAASHMSYRFGAADTASPEFKPKAIAWVMAGGLFAAILGPQLVIFTKDLMPPYLFAASYLGQALFAVLAGLVILLFFRAPGLAHFGSAKVGRPLREIARQPKFIVAVVIGVASYALMNLMMTSAPLAMVDCGHSVANATLGIQWHVLAMYAPSFFTGSLILRFGVARVTAVGPRDPRPLGGGRAHGHHGCAFLDCADPARRRLELRLRRRHHDGVRLSPAGGAQQGAGLQRFPDLRQHGDRIVHFRLDARAFRLVPGQRGDVSGCRDRGRDARLAGVPGAGATGLSAPPGCSKTLTYRHICGVASSAVFWL